MGRTVCSKVRHATIPPSYGSNQREARILNNLDLQHWRPLRSGQAGRKGQSQILSVKNQGKIPWAPLWSICRAWLPQGRFSLYA